MKIIDIIDIIDITEDKEDRQYDDCRPVAMRGRRVCICTRPLPAAMKVYRPQPHCKTQVTLLKFAAARSSSRIQKKRRPRSPHIISARSSESICSSKRSVSASASSEGHSAPSESSYVSRPAPRWPAAVPRALPH